LVPVASRLGVRHEAKKGAHVMRTRLLLVVSLALVLLALALPARAAGQKRCTSVSMA
jgi:hypothetical protein